MIKLRFLLLASLMLGGKTLFAQVVPAWAHGADTNDLSWGFSFQYVGTDFKIVKKPDWRSPFYDNQTNKYVTDSLTSITSHASQGFAVGFIARYLISDHLEVRTTPSLVFADRMLDYTFKTETQNVQKQIQTTMMEFPISLKLKSDRLGNFRAYILGGLKQSILIAGKQPNETNVDPTAKLVKNIKSYSSYEAGIGCDIYFEYFKLSPELKVANSFGNVLVAENHPYSRPIDKLFLHTIMFSLYFE